MSYATTPIRGPDFRQTASRMQAGQSADIDLVGLHMGTFALPVSLSRRLAAYTLIRETGPNIGTKICIQVTSTLEHLNKEVKRRAGVVGIFPNEASIMRLIGAVLFEKNDESQTSGRYMIVDAFAQIDKEEIDPILNITTKAA